jgi:peptide deformylase
MYAANGIGLAATQVNHHIRLVVMDLGLEDSQPLVLINPKIQKLSDIREKGKEGCLSVPDVQDEVERAQSLTLEALDRTGQAFTLEAQGLLAICIQHELDHLNGRVFVQYLSKLKQDRIITKLRKTQNKTPT